MLFKLWIEGLEEYEPFKRKISSINRNFAFSSWFPQPRIYLPLENASENKIEKDITDLIKDFKGGNGLPESSGYEVVNYNLGHARPIGKKNIYRIGKILQVIYNQDIKKLQQLLSTNQISQSKYNKEKNDWDRYWKDTIQEFQNDPQRNTANQLMVVISSDPHDIASMSTGRGWTSCMNLKTGEKAKDVYCEVGYGGFVAYLIRANDKNIEKPLGRIAIRRFDNKRGESIAVPEESVYGQNVDGFMSAVKKWLDSKQKVRMGNYRRIGGEYSDSFENRNFFSGELSNDKIMELINKWMKLDRKKKQKTSTYFIHVIAAYLKKGENNFPDEFNSKMKEFIFGNNVIPTNSWSQGTDQFVTTFTKKFPSYIKKEDFHQAIKLCKTITQANELLEIFPQFVNDDVLKALTKFNNPDKFAVKDIYPNVNNRFKQLVKDEIINEIDNFVIENEDIWKITGRLHDIFQKAHIFKPIPPDLTKKMIDLVNKSVNGKWTEEPYRVIEMLGHTFLMTDTDNPYVIHFYKEYIPKYWDKLENMGYNLAVLGENGEVFLPFLKKKKNEETNERKIERLNFVIDSIESGKLSNKYSYFG